MTIRVRFAPSPTGYLHVGGARTALFNWLLARREGGVFLLRIEDTDRERSTPESVEQIYEGLRWLGLDWDEEPVLQSEGVDRHRADALRLLESGAAYRDFSDPAELAALRKENPDRVRRFPREKAEGMGEGEAERRASAGEPHAIRFRVPDGETVWEDLVHGATRFRNDEIEDLVVLRSDGTPTYNLAVASDDAAMRVTHVIRGDDHVSNTPKQILLHRALGREVPVFAHLPMILGPDGKRLSKRHGATAVSDYREQGILPEAMFNFLALLGWSPGTDEEVLTRDELVQRFSLDRVLKKSSIFDQKKLEWLNGQHLNRTAGGSLVPLVLAQMGDGRRAAEAGIATDPDRFRRLLDLLKPRARTVTDLARMAAPYLTDGVTYDGEATRKHWPDPRETAERLERIRESFAAADWASGPLETALRTLAEERGVGAADLIHPLRVALLGQAVSPGIFEVLTILGRERSLGRLDAAISFLTPFRTPS